MSIMSNEINNTSNETKSNKIKVTQQTEKNPMRPTGAFISASWVALLSGITAYCIGLFNAEMQLNEKGYYLVVLLFGLFSVISVQKSVRDRAEGIAVTDLYYGISWFTTLASVLFLVVGLWKADLLLSEKGFYGMSFTLAIFSAIAVQKNTRDTQALNA